MITWYDKTLPNGTLVRGSWHRGRYRVERLLGEGANGKVYLVSRGKSLYAMKTGYDLLDLQSEVNVLKSLMKSSAAFRGFLVDADDFAWNGAKVPFYVMKYVKGHSVPEFLRLNGSDWLPVLGLHLLRKLQELHSQGWVFGDLKMENVIVSRYGGVELVDFGGVTPKGKAVKQFTEIYDRGYWNAGTRVADEAYDLFAFAVLCIQMAKKPGALTEYAHVLPQNRGVDFLLEEMRALPLLHKVAPFLEKALRGQYRSSAEACRDWRRLSVSAVHVPPARSPMLWLKICFAASLALFVTTVYFFWQHG